MVRKYAYIVVLPDSNAMGLGLCSPRLILRSSNSVAVYVVAGELAADFCFLGCSARSVSQNPNCQLSRSSPLDIGKVTSCCIEIYVFDETAGAQLWQQSIRETFLLILHRNGL